MLIPLGLDDARISRVPWVSLGIVGMCLVIHVLAGPDVHEGGLDRCLVPARGFLQVGWLTAPESATPPTSPASWLAWGRPWSRATCASRTGSSPRRAAGGAATTSPGPGS